MPPRLTRWFSAFLRRHRRLRHFGRHALQDVWSRRGPTPAIAPHLVGELLRAAHASPADAIARLKSHPEGLSAREAAARRKRHGPNEVVHDRPLPAWLHLFQCYRNPFSLLLTVLALLAWIGHDHRSTAVILIMIALATGVRFVQEGRAHRAAEALRALVGNTATVIRRGAGEPPGPSAPREIALRDLVPGDLVALSAGDMVPADCRILSARELFVSQSALTGESIAAEKFVLPRTPAEAQQPADDPLELRNLVFMGTNVVSGTATALVVATGRRTHFGALSERVAAVETTPNAFQAGVNSVSWLLIRFASVMVPIVLVVNGLTKGQWLDAVLFALSVAVGLTPEMLPMVATTTLAKGAVLLSRRKVVVKRLDAIQNFGAMDTLCTDKTGTLTQDRIALARHADVLGRPSDEVLAYAYVNSAYQTGLKNLLDRAVLEHGEVASTLRLAQDWRKIDEVPFDFERRRMSVAVGHPGPDGTDCHELICKGALDEVLAVCTRVRVDRGAGSEDLALDAQWRARVQQLAGELAHEGLRVVAVALRRLPPGQQTCAVADETDLTLLGYVAFLDPPKESAAPALQALAAHGVAVKVLTGDSAAVAAQVCAQVGLDPGEVLLGADIEVLDDAALATAAREHRVFAKLTPLHKERIVRALRGAGHVVGFLGDGINDAPALRAADIGISVDSGVDIAKEAADIILLEKSLLVLDAGVVEGRRVFCNLLKYIRMTASSNFGNVLSVLVASAFLPFLPMLPLQLLVQNLLYDFSQTGIPFDRVDDELVRAPLRWNPADIGRFMLFFGPLSSIFDLATFALMWWVFGADRIERQGLFQTGWFVVGLLTQTLIVHMIRTPRLPFVQSRASTPLLAMTLAIAAFGLWLPTGPLAGYFKFEPLPPAYFAWLAAILLGYATLTTAMKRVYVRHFGWQ